MSTRKGAWQHQHMEFLRQNMAVCNTFIKHKPKKHFFFAAQFGAHIWSGLSVTSVIRDFGADT